MESSFGKIQATFVVPLISNHLVTGLVCFLLRLFAYVLLLCLENHSRMEQPKNIDMKSFRLIISVFVLAITMISEQQSHWRNKTQAEKSLRYLPTITRMTSESASFLMPPMERGIECEWPSSNDNSRSYCSLWQLRRCVMNRWRQDVKRWGGSFGSSGIDGWEAVLG